MQKYRVRMSEFGTSIKSYSLISHACISFFFFYKPTMPPLGKGNGGIISSLNYFPILSFFFLPLGTSWQWMAGVLSNSASDYSVHFPGVLWPVDNHDTL